MDMQKMEEEETLLDLKQQYVQSKNEYALALHTSIETLVTALTAWEQSYVLKASVNGRVNMMDIWSDHQSVKNGDVVFVIVPLKMDGEKQLVNDMVMRLFSLVLMHAMKDFERK